MNISTIITSIVCFGLFVLFCWIMFWVYGITPILHWFIKSNGQRAKAVVLEVRDAGWGWYAGGRYSETLMFQPVWVKLEVHPNQGAAYIAADRFNAKRGIYREKLRPGVELQVSIASFSPMWVASWPETIVEAPAHRTRGSSQSLDRVDDEAEDPKARLRKLNELLSSGLVTQQEYDQKRKEILEDM